MSLLQTHAVSMSLNTWSSAPPLKRYIIMGKDIERCDREDQRYGISGVQEKFK